MITASERSPATYDAVVVGGGPAGLSAALLLGRSRRRVLLADAGAPRNAPAHGAHNVFTRDGTPPMELLSLGRAQLEPYGVEFRQQQVVRASAQGDRFALQLDSGAEIVTRKVLLAVGVRDILPKIPGMVELWGRSLFHCPYCHGWEVAGKPLGIYARGDAALHLAKLIPGWTDDLILFTDGPAGLNEADRERIARRGIRLREERITALEHENGTLRRVILEDGTSIAREGILIAPPQEIASALPHQLGCPINAAGRVEADGLGRTPVRGVFVAGDAAPGFQAVATAAAGGMTAGAALNLELLEEEFDR